MFRLLADTWPLFAQAPPAKPAGEGGGMLPTLIMFAPMVLLFYFIIIRPGQTQEKKRRELIDSLKKNDRVLTQAGIFGTVVTASPESDRVVLRVDDDRGVKLEFSKASIVRVVDQAEKDKSKAAESA